MTIHALVLPLFPVLAAVSPASAPPIGGARAPAVLQRLAEAYWSEEMDAYPTWATSLGVPGHDDRLADISPHGVRAHRSRLRRLLRRSERLDESALAARDRVTLATLRQDIRGELEDESCRWRLWSVDQMDGPQVSLLSLPEIQKVRTQGEARDYLARLRAVGPYMETHLANLRTGLRLGLVAPRASVERVAEQLREIASKPVTEDPLLRPVERLPEEWSPDGRLAFEGDVQAAVQEVVRPAFAKYLEFLEEEVLPRSRTRVGVGVLPGGAACYRAMIRKHTTLGLDPEQVHRLGLEEMRRIQAEMGPVAARLFPGESLEEVLERLRSDPQQSFRTREEVERKARDAVQRAWASLPEAFLRRPSTPVVVERMEAHAEKDAPMAYYRGPAADGSRPGIYYVNTYAPGTRPRYTSEVLAFHEAVPGHHLQIALAQELEGLPEFQKHGGATAFVEGWALYAERVADEMGLYSGDLDRLGMLSFDAWRAARLVVDTGLHAMGWSREEAIAYMRRTTANTLPDIENEVDRYITNPGQALAYKIGQREILRLREEARRRLGNLFDLREFHGAVLGDGALPLSVLRAEVERWIAEREKRPAARTGR